MLVPSVPSRMEEPRHFPGIGIKAGEVCAFVKIAIVAGPRQIRQIVRAAMLSGNNVLHLEGMKGVVLLTQPTVLAPIFRALPNYLTP